jgi:tRNA A37 N6-isopentenylltransferase MiaA
MYQNLDIITNKATKEEMKDIKHNLIGFLDATCITNNISDYKEKAVAMVDIKL